MAERWFPSAAPPLSPRTETGTTATRGLSASSPCAARCRRSAPEHTASTTSLIVDPKRVRHFARSAGRLAKNYPIDAEMIARFAETFVEATYQVQVLPWWQIQPDIQYVVNPGGGLANPNDPTQKIKNELVIGLRTNITF